MPDPNLQAALLVDEDAWVDDSSWKAVAALLGDEVAWVADTTEAAALWDEVAYLEGEASQEIDPNRLASGRQLLVPELWLTLTPPRLSSTRQLFTPSVVPTILALRLASTRQLYNPELWQQVWASRLETSRQLFQPVWVGIGIQAKRLATHRQLFVPELWLTLTPPRLGSHRQLFKPTFVVDIGYFHEVRFPEWIAEGAVGGPGFETTILVMGDGTEQRIAHWEKALWRWDVSHALQNPTEALDLIAFFAARQGRQWGFRFKDWLDYQQTAPAQTVQITSTRFQLMKTYASGTQTYARKITKPVDGTVRMWTQAGIEIVGGWACDYSSGQVHFTTAPGFVPWASFEFDVPVRFGNDQMSLRLDDAITRSWPVELVEVRS